MPVRVDAVRTAGTHSVANPNNPILPDDIHYQHRGGDCFILVDPTLPEGRRDIASTWCERGVGSASDVWRWRMNYVPLDGAPYPTTNNRDTALEAMLASYAADPQIARRLNAQKLRFSFGAPQIVRA